MDLAQFLIWAVLALLVLRKIRNGQARHARVIAMRSALAAHPEFKATHVFINFDGQVGLALSSEKNELGLITRDLDHVVVEIMGAYDVLAVELISRGEDFTTIDRTSLVSRATLGAALAGKKGAVFGALLAKKRHETRMQELGLRITVNHQNKPQRWIPFLTSQVKASSLLYRSDLKEATCWCDLVGKLISHGLKGHPKASLANDLKKLAADYAAGNLNDTDYPVAKSKLLLAD